MLPLVARELGLRCEVVEEECPAISRTVAGVRARLRSRAGRSLGPRRVFGTVRRPKVGRPVTVMEWYGGYSARSFLAVARLAGSRVLYLACGGGHTKLIEQYLRSWLDL